MAYDPETIASADCALMMEWITRESAGAALTKDFNNRVKAPPPVYAGN